MTRRKRQTSYHGKAVGSEKSRTDIPNVKSEVQRFLLRLFGRRAFIALAVVGFILMTVYAVVRTQLPGSLEWPPVAYLHSRLYPPKPLPQANPDRFCVGICHFADDDNLAFEKIMLAALGDLTGIDTVPFDRTIDMEGSTLGEQIDLGHQEAASYLATTGAHVVIWGSVLKENNVRVAVLRWTVSPAIRKPAERYVPTESLDLPENFWHDLDDVIHLLILTTYVEFARQQGQFVADQLNPLIVSTQRLISDTSLGTRLSRKTHYTLRNVLAYALIKVGEQRADRSTIRHAIDVLYSGIPYAGSLREGVVLITGIANAYRLLSDMGEGTPALLKAKVVLDALLIHLSNVNLPLERAQAYDLLGTVLWSLAQNSPHSEERLSFALQAVAACSLAIEGLVNYRPATDHQWARAQDNLAAGLMILADQEADTMLSRQLRSNALSATRVALTIFRKERAPIDWAVSMHSLGLELLVLDRIREAIACFCEALGELSEHRMPILWSITQNSLGKAYSRLWVEGFRSSMWDGHGTQGDSLMNRAVDAYEKAIRGFGIQQDTLRLAVAHDSVGFALLAFGMPKNDEVILCRAAASHLAAWDLYSRLGHPLTSRQASVATRTLATLRSCIGPQKMAECLHDQEHLVRRLLSGTKGQ